MSRFLLDTNILSSLIKERGRSPVLARVGEVGQDRLCTSIIVAAEIRYGVAKKASPRLAEWADRVLLTLDILPFDDPSEIAYASIRLDLERRGSPIGANDLLIAAQCLAHDLTLVTNNRRAFDRVENLRVADWLA